MTNLRGRQFILSISCAVILGACGAKAEPDIPTFDPMDRVQKQEGWKVEREIAVSPGLDQPVAHHVRAIASGMHNIDFETPPTAMIAVTPSCKVSQPDVSAGKYLIVADGWADFPLMKNVEVPSLMTFSNEAVNALGKAQAEHMIEKGQRKKPFSSDIGIPSSNMGMKDVFITETSESVVVALAGGGLYNFHLAPGVRLKGVVVYTGETGYNKSMQAAVAGVPEGVPVNFINQKHRATRGCWTRVTRRPDKSWARRLYGRSKDTSRHELMKPIWKAFERRVRDDLGDLPGKNVISVSRAGHYLIGPAPTRYEDRIPYVAFAGKTIHYSAAEHAYFGIRDDNRDMARQVLDQYYNAHLAAAAK